MGPQCIKPYVKPNKNAAAEAICEAVVRPNRRFVQIKNIEQQAVLPLHRVRQGYVKVRTAQANQIHGLLGEFGLIVPQGIGYRLSRGRPGKGNGSALQRPGVRLLGVADFYCQSCIDAGGLI